MQKRRGKALKDHSRSRSPRRRGSKAAARSSSSESEKSAKSIKSIKSGKRARKTRSISGSRKASRASKAPKTEQAKKEKSKRKHDSDQEELDEVWPLHGYYLAKSRSKKGSIYTIKHDDLEETVELEDGITWKLKDGKNGTEVWDESDKERADVTLCQDLFNTIHTEIKRNEGTRAKSPPGRQGKQTATNPHNHKKQSAIVVIYSDICVHNITRI